MNKHTSLIRGVLAVFLCLMVVLSILDTHERRYDTAFDQDAIVSHIEHLTAHGPRSIVHTDANRQAVAYITKTLESWGVVNSDAADAPAYQIQSFVAPDDNYQNWYLENVIVHIPANAAAPTGLAQMYMGHFDSIPMGPGASDDGVAVGVMLEAIRYYLDRMEQGFTMENDLVFCFVNGEEFALYGSEAFMEEFRGFDDVVSRIRFGTNLESRGTAGTLIMFETAENNYNTVKLFSQVNDNVFTCSIATMIYGMMPNGTDFSSFKDACQGVNMANIGGGENYHTQNDSLENLGMAYLSQQAMMVERLIERLANDDLERLHSADESAIFFTWLNAPMVVYNHGVSLALALILAAMVAANVILNRKNRLLPRTLKALGVILLALAATAGITFACYYLFQYIAVLAGVIDIRMVGTITYSNTAIVVGIGLAALAVSALTVRLLKVDGRDLIRAFAYIHAFLGVALTFFLADASYLFVFSGLLFMAHELLVTLKPGAAAFRGELLVTALYMPVIMPILVLATSALGLTMAYVFGLLFVLGVFPAGVLIRDLKIRRIPAAAVILAAALVIFLGVSLCRPDASANLQGKQSISRLPWDDALVYVADSDGESEYRIYDLNALSDLEAFAPAMTWADGYYAAPGEAAVSDAIHSTAAGNVLTVQKTDPDSLVYLTFSGIQADSFTIDDGITTRSYDLTGSDSYTVTIHSDCAVTVNGRAEVAYREVIRDHAELIPAGAPEKLHFNLWLTAGYTLGE